MPDYRFVRLCRTPQSEAYEVFDTQEPIGRVDLHYTSSVVYANLVIERETSEEAIQEMIEIIDNEVVDSVDTPRDDFLVSVFIGREVGIYSDDVFDDDDLDEEELDEEDIEEDGSENGHR
jgi:hypothetical protein